jgi:hypothetical protein
VEGEVTLWVAEPQENNEPNQRIAPRAVESARNCSLGARRRCPALTRAWSMQEELLGAGQPEPYIIRYGRPIHQKDITAGSSVSDECSFFTRLQGRSSSHPVDRTVRPRARRPPCVVVIGSRRGWKPREAAGRLRARPPLTIPSSQAAAPWVRRSRKVMLPRRADSSDQNSASVGRKGQRQE